MHVGTPHVHPALKTKERRRGRRGHTVLPRAGLGDDALLAHALCKQHLSKRVVDLVRAGMAQVLALEPQLT